MILLRPYWKSKRGNILHQVVLVVSWHGVGGDGEGGGGKGAGGGSGVVKGGGGTGEGGGKWAI